MKQTITPIVAIDTNRLQKLRRLRDQMIATTHGIRVGALNDEEFLKQSAKLTTRSKIVEDFSLTKKVFYDKKACDFVIEYHTVILIIFLSFISYALYILNKYIYYICYIYIIYILIHKYL